MRQSRDSSCSTGGSSAARTTQSAPYEFSPWVLRKQAVPPAGWSSARAQSAQDADGLQLVLRSPLASSAW
jgi:hypothetical protein